MRGLKWRDIDFRQRPVMLSIKRRHDDPEDKRKRQPATKTRARVLAINDDLAALILQWREQRANKNLFPRARKNPFVLVSGDGDPITEHGTSNIYIRLRKRYPSLPENLSTHVLRHDWNDRWIEHFADGGEAAKDHEADQIHQMGWSDRTKMISRYGARARQNRANAKSLELQREYKKKGEETKEKGEIS
jgi:integrase